MPRRREVSDAQIARVARKVFLEQGVHVPVAVIAKELGVSPATVFVRMGTKARLISAALWPPDPAVLAEIENRKLDDGPIDEQLVRIVLGIAEFADVEIPATFTLYAAGLRPKATDDFSDATPWRLRRALASWLRDAVRAGKLDCDPRMATEMLIGTIEARAMHAFLGKRTFTERETRTFVRSLVASVIGKK
ncbi:MAG TPA: TetR/AcrR family transcriptional regulator [Gammaproteobacteria bacterium]